MRGRRASQRPRRRASIAIGYHQLGMLPQDHGDYDTAELRYQASLAIKEEIGEGPAQP